jgi:hypothetical protein
MSLSPKPFLVVETYGSVLDTPQIIIPSSSPGRRRRSPRATGGRLLSFAEAARRLGCCRSKTLPELVRRRLLKTTRVSGRTKVLADSVEELAVKGWDLTRFLRVAR